MWGTGYLDAVRRVFGKPPTTPSVNVLHRNPYATAELQDACWLWHPDALGREGKVRFRATVELTAAVCGGAFTLSADNGLTLWINGRRIAEKGHADIDWRDLLRVEDIAAAPFATGRNVIEVEAINTAPGDAGFIGVFRMKLTNGTEIVLPTNSAAWETTPDGASWKPAHELGTYGCSPWGNGFMEK